MLITGVPYKEVRDQIQAGDIIAFRGRGLLSSIICRFTGFESGKPADVSHIGIVLKVRRHNAAQEGLYVKLIESTSLDGITGVTTVRLSKRIHQYNGEMWWLPLSEVTRQKLDEDTFFDFLMEQDGKPYDAMQAVFAGLDYFKISRCSQDFDKMFCSELAAAGLDKGGCIPHVNASEVHPTDICRWNIYAPDYYQLKGKDKIIRGFNTINIEDQPYCTGYEKKA